MDPEAGRWSEPQKLASSVTASMVFKNPTSHVILVDLVLVNVTTAAASKKVYAGVISSGATGTTADNQIINGATLTSGQAVISENPTVVPVGGSVLLTLSATDATLDAYGYVHFKELTK